MRKKTHILLIPVIVLGMLFFSCKRELNSSWDIDYYGPIGKTRITLAKMVPDNSLEVGSDSLLTLVYEDTLFSLELDTMMKLSDTLSSSKLDVPVTLSIAPGKKIVELTDETQMDIGDALFTSANTKEARIRIETISTSDEPLLVKYSIPSARKNGVPFSVETVIPAPQDTTIIVHTDYLDLQGYTFDFTGMSGNEVNTLITRTEIWIHPDADTVTVSPGDKIYVNTFLENLTLGYAKGYFGTGDFHVQESSTVGLFENIPMGSIALDSIKGKLTIRNFVGMDARVKLNELRASNDVQSLALDQSIVGTTVNVSRATDDWGVITPFEKTLSLNNNNLQDLLQLMPKAIDYDLLFQMNPLGNSSLGNDFIYHNMGLDILLELRTPLNVSIDDLMWVDTMDLDVSQLKGVQSGRFMLETANRLPYQLSLQLYLLDGKQVIDSLDASEITVNSGLLNAQYQVVEASEQNHEIKLSASKIENVKQANRILVQVRIDNPQNQVMYPLRSDQYLDLDLKGDFVYRVNEGEE